jgi:hypothetical protein
VEEVCDDSGRAVPYAALVDEEESRSARHRWEEWTDADNVATSVRTVR